MKWIEIAGHERLACEVRSAATPEARWRVGITHTLALI
jgi:hypothetical protein